MMDSNSMQKFEQTLGAFVESGNAEILNWFIGLDIKYHTNLLNSDIFLDKFWKAFVRNIPNDTNIFNHLINSISGDLRNQLGKLFSSLIETKQENQYSVLLTLFIEKYSEWPVEIVGPIQDTCIKVALEMGAPNDAFLLNAAFRTLSDVPEKYHDKIIEVLSPRIASDDISLRDNTLNSLKLINEKTNNRKPLLIQECIEKAKQLLDSANPSAKGLLGYVLNYANVLNSTQTKNLIELVKQQLTAVKPTPVITIGLDLVQTIVSAMDKRDILGTVLELMTSTQDDGIKNACLNILKVNKSLLSIKQEDQMTKLFGEDWFSDKKKSDT